MFFAILSSRICASDWTLGLRPRSNSFQQSIADLDGGILNGILCLSLIMFVMLIPFSRFIRHIDRQSTAGSARSIIALRCYSEATIDTTS